MKKFLLANLPAAAALLVLLWAVALRVPAVAAENGPLENLQALLLGLGLLGLLGSSPRWRVRSDGWIGSFLAVGLLTMLLREIEFDRFDFSDLVISLGDGTGRTILLGILWVLVAAGAVRQREKFPGWVRSGLRSTWGWCLLLSGLFYVLGAVFDQKLLPLSRPEQQFWEEALETPAALWVALSALQWLRGSPAGGQRK